MRGRSVRGAVGVALIVAGAASVVVGVAPVLLPLVAGGQDRAATALAESWPTPTGTRTGAPPALPRVSAGRAFAVLRVPRFGADYSRVVAEGVDAADVLDTGAIGHYPSTAMPGAVGNFAIAGHREADGGALLHLPDLRIGDTVVVDTRVARFVYRVTWRGTVAPSDVGVIAPNPSAPGRSAHERLITLQTCSPPLIDTDRFIVRGVLVSWSAR